MTGSKTEAAAAPLDFIRDIVADDLRTGRRTTVKTRFPPEPNGYLHIGHAKSICLNFGVVQEFGGSCNLRMDDTNPAKEDVEYVDSIQEDVRWLGFEWPGQTLYASDYFEQLYRVGRRADPAWRRVRRRPQRRSDSGLSRYADRARTRKSVPRSLGRGEPRSLPPDARGRVSRRIARAARADRHGIAQSQPSRSRALSHPARDPSPDRRCVVHLPDVRLRAPAVGSGRAHHAFALYARVRGSPAAVRLGARSRSASIHARSRSNSPG